MWFQNALGKEKIQFMFNNELDIQVVEIHGFSMENFSDLKFNFICKKIPKKYPEKWNKDIFNALNFDITFENITQLDITGSRIGFFCSPIIKSSPNLAEIKVEHNSFKLYCSSDFLTIGEIVPYLDERWD